MEGAKARNAGVVRLQALRCLQVAVAFVLLYWTANELTSLRSDHGRGVFAWERAIPFVEISVLPYLSIFALFVGSFFVCGDRNDLERHCARLLLVLLVSLVCYAAFPLRFAFQRPVPVGVFGGLFRSLWAVDLPFNRAPSLHIGVLVILWARFAAGASGCRRLGLHAWMAAIAVSVLTTYQHHVVDVASGFIVGGLCLNVPVAWLQRLHAVGAIGARPAEAVVATPSPDLGSSADEPRRVHPVRRVAGAAGRSVGRSAASKPVWLGGAA